MGGIAATAPPPACRGPAPARQQGLCGAIAARGPPRSGPSAAAAAAREGEGVINNPWGGAALVVQTVTRDVPGERGGGPQTLLPPTQARLALTGPLALPGRPQLALPPIL